MNFILAGRGERVRTRHTVKPVGGRKRAFAPASDCG